MQDLAHGKAILSRQGRLEDSFGYHQEAATRTKAGALTCSVCQEIAGQKVASAQKISEKNKV